MDYQIILSDLFISDLREIIDYLTEQVDATTAARVTKEILDHAIATGHYPFAGKPVKKLPGARKVLLYSYLIYYDVNEAQHTVEILRAWHGARDPKTLRLKG